MKVEIWHHREGDDYDRGQTLDFLSVSDEMTCTLAFIHTSQDSLTELQGQVSKPPTAGDIFVICDPDSGLPCRAYELSFVDDEPAFQPVDFHP